MPRAGGGPFLPGNEIHHGPGKSTGCCGEHHPATTVLTACRPAVSAVSTTGPVMKDACTPALGSPRLAESVSPRWRGRRLDAGPCGLRR